MTNTQNLFLTQNIFPGITAANPNPIAQTHTNPLASSGAVNVTSSGGFLSFLIQQINDGQDLEALDNQFKSLEKAQSFLGDIEIEDIADELDIDLSAAQSKELAQSLDGLEDALSNGELNKQAIIEFKLQVRDFVSKLIETAQSQTNIKADADLNIEDLSSPLPTKSDVLGNILDAEKQTHFVGLKNEAHGKTNGEIITSETVVYQEAPDLIENIIYQPEIDSLLLSKVGETIEAEDLENLAAPVTQSTQAVDTVVLQNVVTTQIRQALETNIDADQSVKPDPLGSLAGDSAGPSRHQLLQHLAQTDNGNGVPSLSITSDKPNTFGLTIANLNAGTALSNNNVFFDASGQSVGSTDELIDSIVQAKVAPDQTSIQNATSPIVAHKAASQPHPALEQLSVQIRKAAAAGQNTNFSVRMDPPELGMVRIELSFSREKSATARIIAERAETLSLLQRDVHALESALQDAGLDANADSFSFDLAQQDSGTGGNDFSNGSSGSGSEQIADSQDVEEITSEMTRFVDPETGLSRINLIV